MDVPHRVRHDAEGRPAVTTLERLTLETRLELDVRVPRGHRARRGVVCVLDGVLIRKADLVRASRAGKRLWLPHRPRVAAVDPGQGHVHVAIGVNLDGERDPGDVSVAVARPYSNDHAAMVADVVASRA
jgi:hypothetical protein